MGKVSDLSLRGRFAPVAISGRHCRFVPTAGQTHAPCRGGACPSRHCIDDRNKLPINTYQPIASVAAVTAQPLAALPPYGCGVPFTGGERHWQLQIPAHSADRTGSRNCHCEGALRPWQSREGSYVFAGSILLFNRVLRDSHVASLLGMTNLGTSRHKIHTSNIASLQGAHYPQGARRIRKAAKPPTAAQ